MMFMPDDQKKTRETLAKIGCTYNKSEQEVIETILGSITHEYRKSDDVWIFFEEGLGWEAIDDGDKS